MQSFGNCDRIFFVFKVRFLVSTFLSKNSRSIFKKFSSIFIFFFNLFIFSLFIFSCAKNTNKIAPVDTVLRNEAKTIVAQLEWSDELDAGGLPKKDMENDNLPLPEALAIINCSTPIFPSMQDFAILDTRTFDANAFKTLNEFLSDAALKQIEKRQIKADFLDKRFVFLSFILENSFKAVHEVKKIYYAKPILIEETLQIPVRLQGKNVHTDLQVFMHANGGRWVIEQIYFGDQVNE